MRRVVEHDHVEAVRGQMDCRHQPVVPGADDHDPRHRSAIPSRREPYPARPDGRPSLGPVPPRLCRRARSRRRQASPSTRAAWRDGTSRLIEDRGSLVDALNSVRQAAADGARPTRRPGGSRTGAQPRGTGRRRRRRHRGGNDHDGRVQLQEPDAQEARHDRRLDDEAVRWSPSAIRNRRQHAAAPRPDRAGCDAS
jgi:hypothetical protein